VNSNNYDPQKAAIVSIGLGVIALLVAIVWLLTSCWLVVGSLRATGHVIEIGDQTNFRGSHFYFPVYTYTDQAGTEHTIHSNSGSPSPPYHVGDSVTVLYRSGSENNPTLDQWIWLWGVPLMILIVPAVFVPLGIRIYQSI
jgi:hypothetical protein